MVMKLTMLEALEPFLNNPKEKLHLAEIARKLKSPHPTVRQWLNHLEKKGVLKKQFQGRQTQYSLNLEHRLIIDYLCIAEKSRLVNRCEKEPLLKELVYFLHNHFRKHVLIFGSAAESLPGAKDIDILVVGRDDSKIFRKFSGKINKEIHLINVDSLDKISNALRHEVIKKHLIISGAEEFIKWMLWKDWNGAKIRKMGSS